MAHERIKREEAMTRRIRNTIGAAAAIAVVALLPTTASASQVMWEDGMARYKASGGEDNVVKATLNSTGKKVTFQDSGTVIWNAGPGCQIDNDHQATCTKATGIPGIWIGTGSFDDSVQANLGAKLLRLRVQLGSDEDTLSVTGTGYY